MRTEMHHLTAVGPREGIIQPGLRSPVEGLDVVPERVPRDDSIAARALLRADGAAILTGWPVQPDSVVHAAAAVLGTRLRTLEKVRQKTTDGAESIVIDGYRLVNRLQDSAPALYEFLTSADVDVTSRLPSPDVYRPPRVCRLIEWTRGGRGIVRDAQYAQPAPREPRWPEHQAQIEAYADVLATAAAQARTGTALAAGEVMVLDNYRCLHGMRAHRGSRTVHVVRCKSDDAC